MRAMTITGSQTEARGSVLRQSVSSRRRGTEATPGRRDGHLMTEFGDMLHDLLAKRRVSLREAARLTGYSAGYLSNVAAGRRPLTPSLASSLDRALDAGHRFSDYALRTEISTACAAEGTAGSDLQRARPTLKATPRRSAAANTMLGSLSLMPASVSSVDVGAAALQMRWPAIRLSHHVPRQGGDWQLALPHGRLLDSGGELTAVVQPMTADADGDGTVSVEDVRLGSFRTLRHALLIGIDHLGGKQTPRLRALNMARVRHEITRAGHIPSAVTIPRACELDDLSYAIIWAVTAIDDALLADDATLAECQRELLSVEQAREPAVSSDAAASLTVAARLWLGSSFCARHILSNLAEPGALPVFWTREQTGEEACTWLLFRHKYDYLKQISDTFGANPGQPLVRGFCIPEPVVAMLPPWERILLLLAIAMMESLGISVKISAEPGLADVDGFMLLPGQRAVIATWVRAEKIWHAGITTALGDFSEITGYVNTHSLTGEAGPLRRLRALADYLAVDWGWLSRRCAELAGTGCSALIQPHSRLLSTQGIDAATRFVASAAAADAPAAR